MDEENEEEEEGDDDNENETGGAYLTLYFIVLHSFKVNLKPRTPRVFNLRFYKPKWVTDVHHWRPMSAIV